VRFAQVLMLRGTNVPIQKVVSKNPRNAGTRLYRLEGGIERDEEIRLKLQDEGLLENINSSRRLWNAYETMSKPLSYDGT